MRLHVRGADRQGNSIATGVHPGEPATGPVRDIVVQEK